MTQMVSVQVRFPPEELKRIDNYIKKGEYSSRAEFIRDAVRKAEMLRSLQVLREIMKEEGFKKKKDKKSMKNDKPENEESENLLKEEKMGIMIDVKR